MKTTFLVLNLFLALSLSAQEQSSVSDPFGRILMIKSALPGKAVLTQDDSLCSVSSDPTATPIKFKIVPGLSNRKSVSLEVVGSPGTYLRHQDWRFKILPFNDDDPLASSTSTFNLILNSDKTYSLESVTTPHCYLTIIPSNAAMLVLDPDSLRRSFTFEKAEQPAATNL
jgi:Alpha-L-arabinofuranosidase B (ABFB) domain